MKIELNELARICPEFASGYPQRISSYFLKVGNYDSALHYFGKVLKLTNNISQPGAWLIDIINIGNVYTTCKWV